jgi:hypothetical protein
VRQVREKYFRGLFHDNFRISDYSANGGIIYERRIRKDLKRSGRCLTKYCSGINPLGRLILNFVSKENVMLMLNAAI